MKPGSWTDRMETGKRGWWMAFGAASLWALGLSGCGQESSQQPTAAAAPEEMVMPEPEMEPESPPAPPQPAPALPAPVAPMEDTAGAMPEGAPAKAEAPRSMPMVGSPGPGSAAAQPAEASKEFSEVPVYFATDRLRTDSLEPDARFGTERNPQGDHLSYGRAVITIPKTHRTGEVERPVWWRFEFREDVKKHVTMMEPVLMNPETFYEEIRQSTNQAQQKELLMFVHGFNVKYADAMRRTGQITYDLGFGGVAFCYSWPSQGELAKYPVDKENAEWTVPHLTKVLTDLQKETKFEKVHVIAHSMGTRVLSYALRAAQDGGFQLTLNNVILAAPDIDADIFKEQILPKIKSSTQRLTMYASSGDQALNLSMRFNGSRRLGLSGDGLLVVPDLMDTIDASGIDTSLIGHSYYGSQGPVVDDLLNLVIKGLLPDQRNLRLGSFGAWALPVGEPR